MVMMVLLKDACTCAMPSATFLRTFLRTRCAALLDGALAIMNFQSLLFLERSRCFTRTFTRTRIGTRALTTQGQTTTMAKAAIATNVHQTLDVHGGFATQITFNGEFSHFVAHLFKL